VMEAVAVAFRAAHTSARRCILVVFVIYFILIKR
jgi:hypothetical protein